MRFSAPLFMPIRETGHGTIQSAIGGNTYLKFKPSGSTLLVRDYFTPHKLFNTNDQDLGSNTAILLPTQSGTYPHEMVGGDKNGTIYVINRDNMGKFNSSGDQIIQELRGAIGVHISTVSDCNSTTSDCNYSTPAYWNGRIYFAGVNDKVKAFAVSSGLLSGPTSKSAETFGYPGATPTISANGTNNGIVWTIEPARAILHAYSATDLGNELYNSNQNSSRDALGSNVKFVPPAVVNGKVYIGRSSCSRAPFPGR